MVTGKQIPIPFILYLNEDYSDDPTTFAFDWYNTENGEYIQLDDIVLPAKETEATWKLRWTR